MRGEFQEVLCLVGLIGVALGCTPATAGTAPPHKNNKATQNPGFVRYTGTRSLSPADFPTGQGTITYDFEGDPSTYKFWFQDSVDLNVPNNMNHYPSQVFEVIMTYNPGAGDKGPALVQLMQFKFGLSEYVGCSAFVSPYIGTDDTYAAAAIYASTNGTPAIQTESVGVAPIGTPLTVTLDVPGSPTIPVSLGASGGAEWGPSVADGFLVDNSKWTQQANQVASLALAGTVGIGVKIHTDRIYDTAEAVACFQPFVPAPGSTGQFTPQLSFVFEDGATH